MNIAREKHNVGFQASVDMGEISMKNIRIAPLNTILAIPLARGGKLSLGSTCRNYLALMVRRRRIGVLNVSFFFSFSSVV